MSTHVTLPDGNRLELPDGATGADVAAAIGPGLARAALAIEVDGELRDLARTVEDGGAVSILTATTLLPALIAMLGDRVLPGGIVGRVERFFKHKVFRRPVVAETVPSGRSGPSRFWTAWTARVMARPWTAIVAVSSVLLFLAIPLLSLDTGTEALARVMIEAESEQQMREHADRIAQAIRVEIGV